MALGATVYTLDIDLSDSDRSVYETLALRVARHPSESDDYLVTRILAYCLEYTDGIAFSRGGLSDSDEPPIAVRDLTGTLRTWIDIGSPDAARLERRMAFSLSINERELYISIGADTITGAVVRHRLDNG